jgi:DNA-binding response OmpR family regulator
MATAGNHAPLNGVHVLVAEDEYSIAMLVAEYLEMEGVHVVGPAGNLAALDALVEEGGLDAALLDINLGGELVFPLADRLAEAGVPFVLTSGYDDCIPPRFAGVPRCGKPYRLDALRHALQNTLAQRAGAQGD